MAAAEAPRHDVPKTVAGPKPGIAYRTTPIGTLCKPLLQLPNTKCQSLKILEPNFLTKYLIFNVHWLMIFVAMPMVLWYDI
jgi:hypothetical protein